MIPHNGLSATRRLILKAQVRSCSLASALISVPPDYSLCRGQRQISEDAFKQKDEREAIKLLYGGPRAVGQGQARRAEIAKTARWFRSPSRRRSLR